jgi:diguanylate cyclase (GGDEF)-like protein
VKEALAAWRTREGTALLVVYGLLIAVVWTAFVFIFGQARIYGETPLWLRVLPAAVPIALAMAVGVIPPLRRFAHRLQVLSIGCLLCTTLAMMTNRHADGSWFVAAIICMFCVQYAFLRWPEQLAAYASALIVFVVLSETRGVHWQGVALYRLETFIVVIVICIALGSLRLSSLYIAVIERLQLQVQAAELRRQTDRNARMALTDHLTGLLNRAGVNEVLDRALALSRRNHARTALLYIDLDGFKEINDTCGHDTGDLALVEAALRMQYLLRTGETAGRIGGDEFVIVLPSVKSVDAPRALVKRLEGVFRDPFRVGERTFQLSLSIGIAVSPNDGATRLELLSAADKRMYDIKRWRKLERSMTS